MRFRRTGVILHRVWPRCLIVDDSASFRYASRMLLERQGLTVVGVATTLGECVSFVEQFEPDVILEGVSSLQPGHFLLWKDGQLTEEEYWRLPLGVDRDARFVDEVRSWT